MSIATAAKALSTFASTLNKNPALLSAGASAYNTAKSQQFAREQMQFQQASADRAMAFNSAEAQKNRVWQEQMSNTAHQREVKDLIAAGLNPVLSANAGASTPSGATASGYSSSGASGQVDTSYVGAMAQIYSQELARQTNLDIARINQKTQLETAKLGFDASLATANISAQMQKSINDANIRNQEYMAKYYPQSLYGSAAAIGSQLKDLYNNTVSGISNSKAASRVSYLGQKLVGMLNDRYEHKQKYYADKAANYSRYKSN